MDISVFVSDLLFDHDCVMVPGFGGFICNYKPAEIHPVLHYVNPPSKSVSFNVNLNANDGLLINYIAQTGSITYDEAQDLVSTWVDSSKNLLSKKETVILKQVGRVFSDIEGNVQFAAESVNYLKASFALKPISANPVLRGKEVDFTEKFTYETKKQPVKRSYWKIAAVIVLLVGMGTLIQMMRMGVEIRPLSLNEAGVFNFFMHFTDNHEDSMKPVPVEAEKPAEVNVVATPVTSPSKSETIAVAKNVSAKPVRTSSGHGYYIIVGAFSESRNAETAKNDLIKAQPNATIFFEKRGSLTRVGYLVATDDKTATAQLHAAQVQNPAYWLLKK